jgi:hypothetical protein
MTEPVTLFSFKRNMKILHEKNMKVTF